MKTSPARRSAIDRSKALRAQQSYDDPSLGIAERFLLPVLGGKRTLAVLSTPLGREPSMGWVLCHSFGMEQMFLQPLEVAMARTLASMGFAALRFHARGYGDSEASTATAALLTQLEDTKQASLLLARSTAVSRVGFIGGRLGGAVAALAADALGADAMVLWQPVVDGGGYMHQFLQTGVATELASRGRSGSSPVDPLQALFQHGVLDVQGFPLSREAFHEISSLNLVTDLSGFRGQALILRVASSERSDPRAEALEGRLTELGASVSMHTVVHREARTFGQQRYRSGGDGRKADTQSQVTALIVEKTAAWCRRLEADGVSPQEIPA